MPRYDGRDRWKEEQGRERGEWGKRGRSKKVVESEMGRMKREEKRIENKSLQEDGIKLHEGGDLRPAKMNKGEEQWKQEAIRGDAIKWLDRTDPELRARFPALWAVLDAQDSLRAELDAACEFGSTKKTQVQVRKRFFQHYKEKQDILVFVPPSSLPPNLLNIYQIFTNPNI